MASMKRRLNDNLNTNNDAVKQVLDKDLGPPVPLFGQQIQFKGRHLAIGVPFVLILFFAGFLGFWLRLICLAVVVAGCLL